MKLPTARRPKILRHDYPDKNIHTWVFHHDSKVHRFPDKTHGGKEEALKVAEAARDKIPPTNNLRKKPQVNNKLGRHQGVYETRNKAGNFIVAYCTRNHSVKYPYTNDADREEAIASAIKYRKNFEETQ